VVRRGTKLRNSNLIFSAAIAISVIGGIGAASAADLAVRPYTKAPAMVDPAYDWSGFYIGGNIGWDFANADSTSSKLNPASFGTATVSSGSNSWNGFTGGGQIGYNWVTTQRYLLGIEADLSAVNADINFLGIDVDGTAFNTAKIDAFGTLRGRAGIIVSSNWLFYGTGGLAWSHGDINHTQGPCAGDPTCATSPVALGTVNTVSFSRFGWTAGAGVEVGFARSWSAKLEYLYADFGSFSYNYPSFNRTATTSLNEQFVRAGINYHFDGAVVTKY
jgi:outer membrane immunogenic protein